MPHAHTYMYMQYTCLDMHVNRDTTLIILYTLYPIIAHSQKAHCMATLYYVCTHVCSTPVYSSQVRFLARHVATSRHACQSRHYYYTIIPYLIHRRRNGDTILRMYAYMFHASSQQLGQVPRHVVSCGNIVEIVNMLQPHARVSWLISRDQTE